MERLDRTAGLLESPAPARSRTSARVTAAKRLVYVVNYLHPDDTQHFVHILRLLDILRDEHGWEVALLSERGGKGMREVAGHPVRFLSDGGRLGRWLTTLATLARLRRQGHRLVFVRISQTGAILSCLAGRVLGLRVLYWQSGAIHDLDARKPPLQRLLYRLSQRFLVRGVDRWVSGPETMIDYYARELGVRRDKLLLLYNDVDIARFAPVPRAPDPSRPLRVLLVHRFSPVRQTDLYLPAIIDRLNRLAGRLGPLELDMVGEGPELPRLREIAQAAGPQVQVRFRGAIPNARIQEVYAEADLFVMPSYREGFPRVMIEAMAMGLPLVATDAGGSADLVGPLQARCVVLRDDPEGFADRMADLLADPAARAALAEENRAHVRRYSTPVVAAMYDRALSAMLPP